MRYFYIPECMRGHEWCKQRKVCWSKFSLRSFDATVRQYSISWDSFSTVLYSTVFWLLPVPDRRNWNTGILPTLDKYWEVTTIPKYTWYWSTGAIPKYLPEHPWFTLQIYSVHTRGCQYRIQRPPVIFFQSRRTCYVPAYRSQYTGTPEQFKFEFQHF